MSRGRLHVRQEVIGVAMRAVMFVALMAITGCVVLGTSDALVLVEGNISSEHGQCSASVEKASFKYPDRLISGRFKLDYTAGLSDSWFEVEIRCVDGSLFKRRFDHRKNYRLEMGDL